MQRIIFYFLVAIGLNNLFPSCLYQWCTSLLIEEHTLLSNLMNFVVVIVLSSERPLGEKSLRLKRNDSQFWVGSKRMIGLVECSLIQ